MLMLAMRCNPNLVFWAVLLVARLAPCAGERNEIRSLPEGLIFVPEKISIGAPVIVLVEEQGRARQVLEKFTWALTREHIPAIAPLVRKEGEKLSGASAWPQTETLLKKLEVEYQIAGHNLYALGFSASGTAAYDLAFAQPGRFKGIIAAATFAPGLPKPVTLPQRRLKILLVAPEEDEFFGVKQNKKTLNLLKAEGFDVILKSVTGNHFAALEKHADILLRWAAGGRTLPATTISSSRDDQKTARVAQIPLKWSKCPPAEIIVPPIPARDFWIVLTSDGKALLIAAGTGEILRTIPLTLPMALGRSSAVGRLCGTIAVLPVESNTSAGEKLALLLGLDLRDDRTVWEIRSSAALSSSVNGRGSFFGYSTSDGFFHVCELSRGIEKWSVCAGTSCASSGLFSDDRVFFCGKAGVFAYETTTGNKIWEVELSCSSEVDPLALTETGDVLFVAADRQVVGLDARTGSKLWQIPFDRHLTCTPCYTKSCFVVATATSLMGINKKGTRLWTQPLTRPVETPLQPWSHLALLIAGEGQLVALKADSGTPIAASQEKLDHTLGLATSGVYCLGVTTGGALVCYDLSSF
ncbi:MAG: outer membrane protein assembly factor BamB family protein [Kiritimatiellia bacterium]